MVRNVVGDLAPLPPASMSLEGALRRIAPVVPVFRAAGQNAGTGGAEQDCFICRAFDGDLVPAFDVQRDQMREVGAVAEPMMKGDRISLLGGISLRAWTTAARNRGRRRTWRR